MTDEELISAREFADHIRAILGRARYTPPTNKELLALGLRVLVEDAKNKLRMMEGVILMAKLVHAENTLDSAVQKSKSGLEPTSRIDLQEYKRFL